MSICLFVIYIQKRYVSNEKVYSTFYLCSPAYKQRQRGAKGGYDGFLKNTLDGDGNISTVYRVICSKNSNSALPSKHRRF